MESGTELSKEWISLQVDINSRDLLDVFFRTQSHKTINRHGSCSVLKFNVINYN